jgi:hypothetical protein
MGNSILEVWEFQGEGADCLKTVAVIIEVIEMLVRYKIMVDSNM